MHSNDLGLALFAVLSKLKTSKLDQPTMQTLLELFEKLKYTEYVSLMQDLKAKK